MSSGTRKLEISWSVEPGPRANIGDTCFRWTFEAVDQDSAFLAEFTGYSGSCRSGVRKCKRHARKVKRQWRKLS